MTQTFRAVPGVLTREVGGELLLLNSDSELYFALNLSGAAMYSLIVSGRTPSDIASKVAEDFDAPLETIEADLAALLTRLLDKGLICPDA